MRTPWYRRKRVTKIRGFSYLGAALLLCGTLGALAQPLESGLTSENRKLFLNDGKVYTIDSRNSVGQVRFDRKIVESPTALLPLSAKGDGETTGFILTDENSAAFVRASGETERLSIPGEKPIESMACPGNVILYRADSENLISVNSEGKSSVIELPARSSAPMPLGERAVLALGKPGEYYLFDASNPSLVNKHTHPFGKDVQVSISGDQALLWSKEKEDYLFAGSTAAKKIGFKPTHGVKPIDSNQWSVVGNSQLLYLRFPAQFLYYPLPQTLKSDNLDTVQFFESDKSLQALVADPTHGTVSFDFKFAGNIGGKILTGNSVRNLIKADRQRAGGAFLFTETLLEESKIDDDGKPVMVLDLKATEEIPQKQIVKGHTVFKLDKFAGWQPIARDERAQLVGPCQVIGDKVVYAVQTAPPNRLGIKREVDPQYPYPQVVLKAISAADGQPAWTLELPRGEAPSAARFPEKEWPLDSKGHLLLTTENNKLIALSPSDGKVVWTSKKLPLDDSSPVMLEWGDQLTLIATNKTTKRLLVLDGSSGVLLAKENLNALFNSQRALNLLGVVTICLALLAYIYLAGKKKLFIRRIAGLEALDEAVGRATEMGKPVLYVTGLADVDDTQTLAALSILSHVAKRTAEYDTSILATTARAVTFSAAQEVVRDAFTIAGRPDSFTVESVQYISDDQFGYAAGVDGLMVREKPAANFYMGKFYAESLIFAETGYATGAIQIAGTAQANQLPFFVAACDYTLIGEELFAASAYLSGDPLQVGSLRGQDVGKAIVMIILVLASLDLTFDGHLTKFLGELFK